MKNKKIYYIIYFVLLTIMCIWSLRCSSVYLQYKENTENFFNQVIEECNNGTNKYSEEACSKAKESLPYIERDTITLFFEIINTVEVASSGISTTYYNQLLCPLIIFIVSSFIFYREYSSEYYKDKIMRMGYKTYIKKSLLNSYKSISIVFIWLIFTFIVSYLVSGHFDYNLTLNKYGISTINDLSKYIHNNYWFILVFIINLIFNLLFYANIAFTVVKKKYNYIVTIVLSYIIFIFFDVVFELIIGGGLYMIFKISHISDLFSLFNFWVYDSIINVPLYTFFNFFLFAFSLGIVYLTYRNKEKVIIESEK